MSQIRTKEITHLIITDPQWNSQWEDRVSCGPNGGIASLRLLCTNLYSVVREIDINERNFSSEETNSFWVALDRMGYVKNVWSISLAGLSWSREGKAKPRPVIQDPGSFLESDQLSKQLRSLNHLQKRTWCSNRFGITTFTHNIIGP